MGAERPLLANLNQKSGQFLLGLFVVALAAVGCSSQDTTQGPDTSPPNAPDETGATPDGNSADGTTGEPENQEPVSATMGVNRNIPFMAVWIAQELGLYEEHGVSMELVEVGGGAELRTALISGATDFTVQSVEGSALLFEQGEEVPNIIATSKNTWTLVLSERHEGAVQPGDVSALEGMTIGVTGRGGGSDMQLQAVLRRGDLVPDEDVQIVAVGGGFEGGIAGMRSGDVDGIMAVQPATSQALEQGGFAFLDFGSEEPYPGAEEVPLGSVATTATYLDSNEEVARGVAEAVVEAMIYISNNPDDAADMVADIANVEASTALEIVESDLVDSAPHITENGWQTLVGILQDGGVIEMDPPYDLMVASQFSSVWDRWAEETEFEGP